MNIKKVVSVALGAIALAGIVLLRQPIQFFLMRTPSLPMIPLRGMGNMC
jgi:hypothetical protein